MKTIFKKPFIVFEKMVVANNKWSYIPGSQNKVFYFVPHEFKGKPIKIDDGTIIRAGDLVAEIHIDNLRINNILTDYKSIYKLFNCELKQIAKICKENSQYDKIKAVHGTTVMYPIARKVGFTIIDIQNLSKRNFLRIWDNILRRVFRKDKLKSKNKYREPKECWISLNQLGALKYEKSN